MKVLIKEKQLAMGSNVSRRAFFSRRKTEIGFSLMKRQVLSMLGNHVGEQRWIIYRQSPHAPAHSTLNERSQSFAETSSAIEYGWELVMGQHF